MTIDYLDDAQPVASVIQMMSKDRTARITFDGNSYITLAEITTFIEMVQDEIDNYTQHAWREVQVLNQVYNNRTGYRRMRDSYVRAARIKLKKKSIRTLSGVSGDKIELFTGGGAWIDVLDTGVSGVGLGNGTFYLDLYKGILYLHDSRTLRGPGTVRLSYRYGETSVPEDIKRACAYLTAVMVVSSDNYMKHFPNDQQGYPIASQAEWMEKKAYRLLDRYKRITNAQV